MYKQIYVKSKPPKRQDLPAFRMIVETYWLFGFIPIYRKESLLDLQKKGIIQLQGSWPKVGDSRPEKE